MSDRPIASQSAHLPPQATSMDEEAPELKQTGADFYLKMIEKMQAEGDPGLGQNFTAGIEDEAPVDFASMTLEQKLKDKNAKTKLAGIEELTSSIGSILEEKIQTEYFQSITDGLSSPMPNLQKACLELCLRVLLEKNTSGWINNKELVKQIFEKVVPNMKPQVKKSVIDFLTSSYQLMGKDEFAEVAKEVLGSKNPKIKASLIKLLGELLACIGLKDFNAVKLWDQMAKESDSYNPMVKKEFVGYSAEVYRWIGDAFSQKLASIKKMTADEVKKAFDEKKESDGGRPPIPTLEAYQAQYIKRKEESSNSKSGNGLCAADAFDLFDPVDIFKGYNEKWVDKVLSQAKWIDKKTMTDEFIDTAQKHPKHTGNYFPIIQLAKRLIDDSNINVQSNAVKLLTAISKGLRKELAREGRKIISLVLPKLKERKKLTDEITDCLKQSVHYIQPQETVDDYEVLFVAKNNLLKGNALEWFNWYVSNSPQPRVAGFLTAFSSLLIRLSEDGAIEVRDANLAIISKIVSVLGNSNEDVARLLEKLPKAQLDKLQPEKGTINSLRTTGSAEKRSMISNSPGKLNRQSSFGHIPAQRKMDVEKTVNPNKRDTTTGGSAVDAGFSQVRLDLNLESAIQSLAAKGITLEEFNSLQNQQWKVKVEYLQRLGKLANEGIDERQCDAIAVLMTLLLKNFKEANPNLLKEYCSIVENMFASCSEKLSGRFVYSFGWFLAEKYGDPKFLEKQNQIIEDMGAQNRPKLALSLCELISSKNPSPKSHTQLLAKLGQLVDEDAKSMPRKELTMCAKESASNNNAGVREEATKFFCTLYKQYGEVVKKAVGEVNPQLRKVIEGKLEKIQPAEPMIDENAPRKDISQQIVKLIPKLNDQKWLVRKEGLTEIDRLIKSSGRLSTKGLNDFASCLKCRLGDSNQVVAREAMLLLKTYIKALGADFKGQSRLLLPLVVPGLSDKLDQVRDTVKDILGIAQTHIGSEWIMNLLVACLTDANSELVLKVLEYIAEDSNYAKLKKADLKVLGKNLVGNLIHKNSSIRTSAEKLMEKVCNFISKEGWAEACRSLNPTTKVQVDSVLSKYLQQTMEPERVNTPVSQSLAHRHGFGGGMDIENPIYAETCHVGEIEKPTQRIRTGEPITNALSSFFNRREGQSAVKIAETSEDFIVIVSYAGPKDNEIAAIKEKLASCFDEHIAEKMFSLEQAKLIDSLSNLGLVRMTNPDKYMKLLCLILNWMYVRVFDTNRKHTLDLFTEFLLNIVEEFTLKQLDMNPNIQSKVLRVFVKILDHHPDKEECLRFINKFCLLLSKSTYKQDFFSLLLESIGSPDIDPQVISILLTNLLEFVDVRKCLSLRTLKLLENYTNSLPDLIRSEIYHFYARSLEILGSKFLEVFRFSDKRSLQKYFDIANPEEQVPTQTLMMICLRRFQTEQREDKIRAMNDLCNAIDEASEAILQEVKTNSSLLAMALVRLHEDLVDNLNDQEYADSLCIFRQKLFALRRFTTSLNSSSMHELLNCFLVLMIKIYKESKSVSEASAAHYQRISNSTNSAVIGLNMTVSREVSLPTLLDMITLNYRQLRAATGAQKDMYSTKQIILVNCTLNITKHFAQQSESDNNAVVLSLDKIQGFFEEFTEGEKSAAHKAMRTVVSKFCELLGEKTWGFYQKAMDRRQSVQIGDQEGQIPSNALSNLIKMALISQQAHQQTEETLYRRRKDLVNLEDKENRDRDLEIQKLSREVNSMVGKPEEIENRPPTTN